MGIPLRHRVLASLRSIPQVLILSVPEDEIRDAKVLFTIVGGEVKYRSR
jgi:hypothetical protein